MKSICLWLKANLAGSYKLQCFQRFLLIATPKKAMMSSDMIAVHPAAQIVVPLAKSESPQRSIAHQGIDGGSGASVPPATLLRLRRA